MRLLVISLLLPALVQEPNEAEKLFRKMEKQFVSASTLQFQFETLLEGGLEKGAKVRGTFAVAYANLGSVLLQQGRTRDAMTHLEKAVQLNPQNVEALNSLSVAYAAAGDVEKALSTIDRALKLNPSADMQKLLRQRRELLTRR